MTLTLHEGLKGLLRHVDPSQEVQCSVHSIAWCVFPWQDKNTNCQSLTITDKGTYTFLTAAKSVCTHWIGNFLLIPCYFLTCPSSCPAPASLSSPIIPMSVGMARAGA